MKKFLKILGKIFKAGLLIILIASIVGAIFLYQKYGPAVREYQKYAKETIENTSPESFKIMTKTHIYDSDGNLLTTLKTGGENKYLEYKDIPENVVNAFVAVEDQSFWENPGIDIKGMSRVLYRYVTSKGEEAHGASTITQQLMRNNFLTREVSMERKGKEIFMAMEATKKYSKKQIMEFYINDICFANAYYGIEAASEGYFSKPISECSLSEVAYLCAIPNSPEYYNPLKDSTKAIPRRNKILKDMLSEGYISKTEYVEAIGENITLNPKQNDSTKNSYQVSYAIDCATEYLMQENGFDFKYEFANTTEYNKYQKDYSDTYAYCKNMLYTNDYEIYTTLDSKAQENLQNKVNEVLSFSDKKNENTGIYELQGAVTAIDNSTGKVIAIIGGRSQEEIDNKGIGLNRAYQSFRQPGSSIKPLIVYTPSLENGLNPESKVKNIDVSAAKKNPDKVQELPGEEMTLRHALEQSKNGVAWALFDKNGAEKSLKPLQYMRFSRICPDDYYVSSSLGGLTHGVSTVEMANAYNTLVNHGVYTKTSCISRIINDKGEDIFKDYRSTMAYEEYAADEMIDMMKGVLTDGTAKKLKWYKSTKNVAACKTGTTNDNKDGWLCGVTPQYSIAVWVGYDTPKTMNGLYGSSYPAQIWKECMLSLLDGKDVVEDFEKASPRPAEEIDASTLPGYRGELPEEAYTEYYPDVEDTEMISDGYYAYNYRSDRLLGKEIMADLAAVQMLNRNASNFYEQLAVYSTSVNSKVEQIYSISYKHEMNQLIVNTFAPLTAPKNEKTERTSQENISPTPTDLALAEPETPVQNKTDEVNSEDPSETQNTILAEQKEDED